MKYRFSSLASLADYLANRATMFRESADNAKSKQKRALFMERAITHEMIADMIRKTTLDDTLPKNSVEIDLNPQREN